MDLNKLVTLNELNFEVNRFWSSPERLPLRNVIGVVLNNPSSHDVSVLCAKYGVDVIKKSLESMIEKNELKDAQIILSKKFIESFETEFNV